jgi:hypothetical protein
MSSNLRKLVRIRIQIRSRNSEFMDSDPKGKLVKEGSRGSGSTTLAIKQGIHQRTILKAAVHKKSARKVKSAETSLYIYQ